MYYNIIPQKIRKYFQSLDDRTKKANKNTFYMLLIKGISMCVTIMYAPLLINQMTRTNYGIWLTLSSIIGWFSFMDIGLGHGLRNYLAKAIAEDNTKGMKELVATSYATMSAVAAIVIFLVLCSFGFIDWASVLNAPKEMNRELTLLAIVAVTCFFLNFVLRLLNTILLAIQKPAYSSYIGVVCHVVAFLIVLTMSQTENHYSLLAYGSIISIVPVIGLFIYTFVLFNTKLSFLKFKLSDINFSCITPLFSLGIKFFMIQITAMLLFQANNFIIAHVSGPEFVADYNVAFQYLNCISMVYSIIVTPIWSSTTDAYFRKDYIWIEKTVRHLTKVWIFFAACGILMVLIAPIVYKIWLSDLIHVDYIMMIMVLVYVLASMLTGLFCGIINGIGKVKLQFYITAIEAIIHLPLAIGLGMLLGIYGVLASMCLMTLINVLWEPIQIKKLISNEATGLWNS